MSYERYPIECPSFTEENERRYADILNGTSFTKCVISPIYYYIIHFGGTSVYTVSSVEIVDTDTELLILGELATEPKREDKVVEEIRNIKTIYPIGKLEESPCTVTMIHRHEDNGKKVSHVHFICSTASLIRKSENIERILRGIRRIADKYAIRG